jgi:Mlc titration factor MtfA (ptsG expression regulator)
MDALIWCGLIALALALLACYPRWRLARALAVPLPATSLAILERKVPVYARMPLDLQRQLQRLVIRFLHQKKIVGCAGLVITEEMRVTIAGQACLLLLNRPTRVYPMLNTILVYPGSFVVDRADVGPGGVVTATEDDLLGESWGDGRVILAWDHVQSGAADWTDGQNVVLHEFAHQLDSESGSTNGAPFLGSASRYRRWAAVLSRDFAKLRRDAFYQHQGVLDHYGATDPAEFFAVATETFFEKPQQMALHHAELFAEFEQYYRVDPRAWLPPPNLEQAIEASPEPLQAAVRCPI